MIFYYAPKTVSVASQIALEEAGAEYELRKLDFATVEQRSADYLKINPKGRVPALVVDAGIITETPAILAYIAQTYPEAQLAPLDDNFQFAKMQEFNSYLASTVHVAHAHKIRGTRWVDDEAAIEAMKAKVPQTMHECFQLIENEMYVGPWVLGENFSVSDCYVFCVSTWLKGDGVDINDFARIADHNKRMRERTSVQKILALHGIP
ncbi:MAG: glutathione S-transferase family protein [Proteobacteria bacterium]|nr:glutathione S-transferase family protein [Pseudomonadota bacterium]